MNAELIEYTDDEYARRLDDENEEINILGYKVGAGTALREIDPIAFEQMMTDEPEEWKCGECGEVFGSEEEAEECCNYDDIDDWEDNDNDEDDD